MLNRSSQTWPTETYANDTKCFNIALAEFSAARKHPLFAFHELPPDSQNLVLRRAQQLKELARRKDLTK